MLQLSHLAEVGEEVVLDAVLLVGGGEQMFGQHSAGKQRCPLPALSGRPTMTHLLLLRNVQVQLVFGTSHL